MSNSKCHGCDNPEYLCACPEIDYFSEDLTEDAARAAKLIGVDESEAYAVNAAAVLEEVHS